jgi:hypothetical protein
MMNDPTLIVIRVFQLTFVPIMLTTPLIVVVCMLAWRKESTHRELIRTKITQLTVATVLCVLGWLAFLITAFLMRSPMLQILSTMAWLPFFPLWFLGAMPIAKLLFAQGQQDFGVTTEKRTASLINRQSKNPLQWWHWGLSISLCVALLVATFLIGQSVDQTRWTPQQQFIWFWGMLGYSGLLGLTYIVLRFAIRASLSEPEPLDAHGSLELQHLYDESRSSRILGLFWLVGFLQPVFFGACLLLSTWFHSHNLTAILGASGGTLLGIAGSWMGVTATLQRLKIARLKMELEAGGHKNVVSN